MEEKKTAAPKAVKEAVVEKINAGDARNLADSTNYLSNRIFKEIKELAKEGAVELTWEITSVSKVTLNRAVTDLKGAGYKVKVTSDSTGWTVNIRW